MGFMHLVTDAIFLFPFSFFHAPFSMLLAPCPMLLALARFLFSGQRCLKVIANDQTVVDV